MASVRLDVREITVKVDRAFKALIPSFEPITDSLPYVTRVDMGDRTTFVVKIPNGYTVDTYGSRCVKAPDGQLLEAIEVMTRAFCGSEGFRLVRAEGNRDQSD
jgi:hypothetical protein